jgi:hypothetical protein
MSAKKIFGEEMKAVGLNLPLSLREQLFKDADSQNTSVNKVAIDILIGYYDWKSQ